MLGLRPFALDGFLLFLSAPWSEEIHSRQALIVRSTVGWKQVAMIKRANCHRRRAKLKVKNNNTCPGCSMLDFQMYYLGRMVI